MQKTIVDSATIEAFLSGRDPQKYIVAVEGNYNSPTTTLIVNDPVEGKRKEVHPYKPFLWFKQEIGDLLFEGKRLKRIEAAARYGVKITALRVDDETGFVPPRMDYGYRFMATCSKSYNDLVGFFREGGIDVFSKDYSKQFVMFSPAEQYLIQSGKRLFKGIDDYNDVHRLQFDLETAGLNANVHAIFQIGIRDNRGFEEILEITGNTEQEKRDSERLNLKKFFRVIDMLKPDVITGYNSEAFDWNFIVQRCERLNLSLHNISITLDDGAPLKRKASKIKFGGEMEDYMQTSMYGYNIIDIAHSVRRAQAINSDIQKWSLKYITQYSEIAKPNRVYILGDKLHTIWSDVKNEYAFNDVNGDWYILDTNKPLKQGYIVVSGAFIVRRYLLDDLWETEHIDSIFNQATFLIGKLLPTTYQRSSTMGTAGQWKLLMAAWSYENKLAIPATESKREFTGGLSRLLKVGYSKGVDKFDYAALYPKTQLTWDIFPPLDISGVMKGLLTYIVETRDKFKFLTEQEKDIIKGIKKKLENKSLSPDEVAVLKKELQEHSNLKNMYDKKQLPLKILANSWFGSYGAPYIFNWGETDYAEETTCRGRQALRLMVKFFKQRGFDPLVLDTDGCNFQRPSNIDEYKYTALGSHWKTTDLAGQELTGVKAVLAEFNETLMEGWMGLDLDDSYNATINFSRKNYANDLKGKVKLVGNSIKSKKMPTYIEEFLAKAIRLLLDGKGQEFIEYYYEYVNKIYNFQIPLVKIASKSKVTISMNEYRKKATMKNKAGNPMPKQAHMELALKGDIDVTQGDVLYYVNTGTAKSHGDLKSTKNKETGVTTVALNCKLIDTNLVESDSEAIKEMEMLKKSLKEVAEDDGASIAEIEDRIQEIQDSLLTDEYNVARYLSAFNKKLEPLLICFHPDIRSKILISIKKDKKDKIEKLQERSVFTTSQCELCSGMPMKDGQQDDYDTDLMTMEDKEIKFWDKVGKLPNYMEQEEWETIRADWKERLRISKIDGINKEKERLDEIFKHLEVKDLTDIKTEGILPIDVFIIADVSDEAMLISRKWGVELCHVRDMFVYEKEAIERSIFYQQNNCTGEDKYTQWLDWKAEQLIMTGETIDISQFQLGEKNLTELSDLIKEKIKTIEIPEVIPTKKKKVKDEDDEDDDEEDDEESTTNEPEQDDFQPELEQNAYLEEVGAIHVATRPNIKVYPPHVAIIPTPIEEPKDEPTQLPSEIIKQVPTPMPNMSFFINMLKEQGHEVTDDDEYGF